MSGTKGRWSRLWVDDFDLSTKTASAEVSIAIGTEEVTAFQSTGKEFITTDPESSISLTGYVSDIADDAGGLEQELADRFAAANVSQVGLMLADSASGDAGMPVYVLRANTVVQMERFLSGIFELPNQADETGDMDEQLGQTRQAIDAVLNGERWVELPPASSHVRRLRHQMVEESKLVSHSYGKEPNRRVRIFRE